MEKDIISSFAFKTAKEIEKLIKEQTDNLKEKNILLEARILNWYARTKDDKFADFMGIKKHRENNSQNTP